MAALSERLSGFNDGRAPEIVWEWLPERDWSEEWKRGLGPRRVGERIIVAPTWTDPAAGPSDVVITIDPQMAFGTGEHASTRGALRLLERFLPATARALDVGTGSAVLAIAAALLGAREVVAVEADADSLINARENVERHGTQDRIELVHRLADPAFIESLARPRFDLILANILSSVIVPLLPALRDALAPQGILIVAGILQEEADKFLAAAASQEFSLLREDREDQWWSAALSKAHPADPQDR